jgi:hypothetical protein
VTLTSATYLRRQFVVPLALVLPRKAHDHRNHRLTRLAAVYGALKCTSFPRIWIVFGTPLIIYYIFQLIFSAENGLTASPLRGSDEGVKNVTLGIQSNHSYSKNHLAIKHQKYTQL